MVNMKSALFKDTFREIRRTKGRFISIFIIVALGVGFFAGIKATCPDMKITADKYYDDYNLMDVRLISTVGFNNDDINRVKKQKGIEGIFPTYSIDTIVSENDKDFVIKVMALPVDKVNAPDENYINRVKLVKGRYPQKPNECVAEKTKFFDSGMEIGSKISLSSGTDKDINESLKTNEFTIVGIVETPYYVSFERGTSAIGNGKINNFIMIPQETFILPVYTDIFLTLEAAKKENSYSDAYKNVIEGVKLPLEDIGKERAQIRYNEILDEANKKIEGSKAELAAGEKTRDTELSAAASKLSDWGKQIEDGEKKLNNKEKEVNTSIKGGELQLVEAEKELAEGEKEYNIQLQSFNNAKAKSQAEFDAAQKQIDEGQMEIDKNETILSALKASLAAGDGLTDEQKAVMQLEIQKGEDGLNKAKTELTKAKAQLEAGKKKLNDGEAQLQASRQYLDAMKKQVDSKERELSVNKAKAQKEFGESRKKLEDSKKELESGQRQYDIAKQEADAKIEDGRKKIADAEEQVKKLDKPSWYVLDRNSNYGFVEYLNASDRMNAISRVFPVFFFLIAALVCLTTMTRMVEEERGYIGTLKALGYSKFAIASKYLIYAVFASLAGSITGILVGFKVFPTVIFNAYGIIFTMPSIITEFNVPYAAASTAVAVLATSLAAWSACYKDLMVDPAVLMRPKAPKSGKRIFLERIKFLWTRLNFTQKITARNLFRYKKRFFMTVLGIGGCTALLLAGFGLKDSIMDITEKQFDELYQYDMSIDLAAGLEAGQHNSFIDGLSSESRVTDFTLEKQQNITVGKDNNEKSAALIVPESTERLPQFILLRDRSTGRSIALTDKGVVLTEKLAKLLQVKTGDRLYIKNGDTNRVDVQVEEITENYVSHYVYMSPKLYEALYNERPVFQTVLAKTKDTSEASENKLSTDLLKNSEASSVSFTTGISKNFKDIIKSLNYIILVLIISAGALAFVVLYNLTNVNVEERLREIATIKVLGFYDKEVSAYVYRENALLTAIGMCIGLFLGIFLHKFIVVTSEVDYVMFGRLIKPMSYLYSAVLTVLFAALVNFVMYFRLKKIDMVESLKSVD